MQRLSTQYPPFKNSSQTLSPNPAKLPSTPEEPSTQPSTIKISTSLTAPEDVHFRSSAFSASFTLSKQLFLYFVIYLP